MVSRFGYLSKAWDTDSTELQSLYGFSLDNPDGSKPKLGAEITLPLSVSSFDYRRPMKIVDGNPVLLSEEEAQQLPPTVYYLSHHFGETRWIEESITNIVRQTKGVIQPTNFDPQFFRHAYSAAQRRLERRLIVPHRRELQELERSLYLYCVPSIKIETDMKTGRLRVLQGKRVLCLLPKKPEIARYYGITEAQMQPLANQTLWLIMYLCNFTIDTPSDFIKALDEWPGYAPLGYRKRIRELIEQANPCVISPRSVQALLQGER